MLFESMGAVVARLQAAIASGERITVHGDFDVDGVCATAVAVGTLRDLGADCDWLIPDRLADGYGIGAENLRRAARSAEPTCCSRSTAASPLTAEVRAGRGDRASS